MSKWQDSLARYEKAVAKAADWIVAKQSKNGAIEPAGGISSVYKTSMALVTTGRLDAAWRLMDFVAANYVREPGEFLVKGQSSDPITFYRNSYILIAAARLGRFDIASQAAFDHFFRHQHRSGGFCAGLAPAERKVIDPLNTAMGGWVALYTGRMQRAERAGDLLVRLIKNQPDAPSRFYFNTDARTGKCVTEHAENQAIMTFADATKPKQHFFYAGGIMGFLADLHRAAGKDKHLDAACKMFEIERNMHPKSFAWPSKCKVGWGAALLYSVTGHAKHRRMAEHVADVTFLDAQHRDGSWEEIPFPVSDDGEIFPLSALETTAEFTFELQEMIKAFGRASK